MGIRFMKLAVLYFLVGMGMFMSIIHKFEYAPSHTHINLLGWTSLALAGVIYHLFPDAGESRLGKLHFWLHNLGLPVFMSALIAIESGVMAAEPLIALGANVTSLGILLFVINVFLNVKQENNDAGKFNNLSV
ncbi:cytochrome-c oxidase [Bacillus marinisedimentorum]|uniref:cytochrome-c oxidase n=1 Tax=Bacillus marinisedimentorum TaxID=1821260 RepID=UPI000871DE68|nr:cytochrome-c oxidase [Bacillus marinisedimentorum]